MEQHKKKKNYNRKACFARMFDFCLKNGMTIQPGHDLTKPAMCKLSPDFFIFEDLEFHSGQGPFEVLVASLVFGYDLIVFLETIKNTAKNIIESIEIRNPIFEKDLILILLKNEICQKFPILESIGKKQDGDIEHNCGRMSDVKKCNSSIVAKMGTRERTAVQKKSVIIPDISSDDKRIYSNLLNPCDIIHYDGIYFAKRYKNCLYITYIPKEYYKFLEFHHLSRGDYYVSLREDLDVLFAQEFPNILSIETIGQSVDKVFSVASLEPFSHLCATDVVGF